MAFDSAKNFKNGKTFHVALAGNIGCGKTSLTTLVAQRLGWRAFYEIVETNPYLGDFYDDMRRWSFHTQIYFLTKRFRHLQEILSSEDPVIQDRSIYEDAEVFAKNLYFAGAMDERDYRTYSEHFQVMEEYIKPPHLLIYLQSDVNSLFDKIEKRGRKYEGKLSRDYIERLNGTYDEWARNYTRGPILTIDVSQKDFVNQPKDLEQVLSIIKWEVERIQNKAQTALPFNRHSGNRAASNGQPEASY